MRTHLVYLLAPLSLACTPSTDALRAGLLAEDHPPLRSPCVATDVPLRHTLRLTCAPPPSSPEIGDSDLWPGERPSSADWTGPDGDEGDVRYDYAAPYTFGEATYRSDGNIETAAFSEYFPDSSAQMVRYSYDGATLIGARVELADGSIEAETEIVYEDGRRKYEGLVGSPDSRVEYTYDTSGRVVSRIGACARGHVPAVPQPEMLVEACPSFQTPQPLLGYDCRVSYYFRDSDGRITTSLHGTAGGAAEARVDFTWDGDRIVGADRTCSTSGDPAFQNVRFDYTY